MSVIPFEEKKPALKTGGRIAHLQRGIFDLTSTQRDRLRTCLEQDANSIIEMVRDREISKDHPLATFLMVIERPLQCDLDDDQRQTLLDLLVSGKAEDVLSLFLSESPEEVDWSESQFAAG